MTSVVRVRSASDQALALIQSEFPNYHPLVSLARLANRADVLQDAKLELEVHKAILPYVAPKLANVEVKTSNVEDRRVVVSLFEDVALPDGRTAQVEVPLIREFSEIVPLD